MALTELSPATIHDARTSRRAMRPRRSRSAMKRQLANAVVILGLGIAIGLLTAAYELDRQERGVRTTAR